MKRLLLTILFAALLVGAVFGVGSALSGTPKRTPVEFYPGHTHDANGLAIDAPEHSGGTDRNGCHNASVPYHCH